MPRRDPRKGKLCRVHWDDAVSNTSERMIDALNDNKLASQVSTGYVSKKTRRVIQVMTTTEAPDTPLEEAECDYINIPREWIVKIEPIGEEA